MTRVIVSTKKVETPASQNLSFSQYTIISGKETEPNLQSLNKLHWMPRLDGNFDPQTTCNLGMHPSKPHDLVTLAMPW